MTNTLLALFLAAGMTAAQPMRPVPPEMVAPAKAVRDFRLHFEHTLGASEAKRRVAERIESLREKFGDKLDQVDVTWEGNEADIRVKALSQSANGHISIDDTSADVRVHLPLLLSAFGDQVRKVVNSSALGALK